MNPKKYYTWKEELGFGDDLQIGTSAQEIQKVYPELVSYDDNGYLTLSYDRLSIVALAAIDKLHEENKKLKKRIEALEKK